MKKVAAFVGLALVSAMLLRVFLEQNEGRQFRRQLSELERIRSELEDDPNSNRVPQLLASMLSILYQLNQNMVTPSEEEARRLREISQFLLSAKPPVGGGHPPHS